MQNLFKAKRFLVIEDSKFIIHILTNFFQSLKAHVDFVTDFNDESKISSKNYDIILLDLVIDKKNTLSLIPKFKAENPAAVVIVISSYVEMLDESPNISDLVDYIISKPFKEFELKELFAQIVIPEDKRISPRKVGYPQVWVARYNKKLERAEVFESPFLINISETGMAFESVFPYSKDDELVIWLLLFEKEKKHIIEFRADIVWVKSVENDKAKFAYGVHFNKMSDENKMYFSHYMKSL